MKNLFGNKKRVDCFRSVSRGTDDFGDHGKFCMMDFRIRRLDQMNLARSRRVSPMGG
jgi:hypothetical protein